MQSCDVPSLKSKPWPWKLSGKKAPVSTDFPILHACTREPPARICHTSTISYTNKDIWGNLQKKAIQGNETQVFFLPSASNFYFLTKDKACERETKIEWKSFAALLWMILYPTLQFSRLDPCKSREVYTVSKSSGKIAPLLAPNHPVYVYKSV